MASEGLTVDEALAKARLIDLSLDAWVQTAPKFVASLGGRDALAALSEMSCIGAIPRLDVDTWERASAEHLERSRERFGAPALRPRSQPVVPPTGAQPTGQSGQVDHARAGRSWGVWSL